MAGSDYLTVLEQQVFVAILRLNPEAYGVSIRDTIRDNTGRDCSFGSIYAVLERMETKGYIESYAGPITAKKGGRRKIFYTLTGTGSAALASAFRAIDDMRADLRFKGVTP